MPETMLNTILRKLRHVAALSQAQVAEKLGVSVTSVSLWERTPRTPRVIYLKMLANLYNVPLEHLVRAAASIEATDATIDLRTFLSQFPHDVQEFLQTSDAPVYVRVVQDLAEQGLKPAQIQALALLVREFANQSQDRATNDGGTNRSQAARRGRHVGLVRPERSDADSDS